MLQWLSGHDDAVAGWAGQQFGVTFMPPFAAFGVLDASGTLVGAAVWNNYIPGGNIELSYVGPGTLTRRIIEGWAVYAFMSLAVSRVTVRTKRSNKVVAGLISRLGFRFEGVQKRFFGPEPEDDAMVSVWFRADADKWLKRRYH